MDIVLIILPKIEPSAPTTGPALLKAHLSAAGFTSKVLDFNVELYRALKEGGDANHYFHYELNYEERFFNEVIEKKYAFLLEKWITDIVKLKPRYVGFSALTPYSIIYLKKLSRLLRKADPWIKIVWGGAAINPNNNCEDLESNLLDYFILGDGEKNIVNLLQGNMTKGINFEPPDGNWEVTSAQLEDLSEMLVPDYSDIMWDLYETKNPSNAFRKIAYVTGSRGCVKTCDFCSVREVWPVYRFRPALNIVAEIKELVYKYGRNTIEFTDSLINGSMREYRILLEELVKIKNEIPEFEWHSQWVIRSERQSPEYDYKLMSQSGCHRLDMGLESFSQSVRYQMGKKFTDEDMWWCFDMLKKYRIGASLLMIVGYPTETDEDHQHTLRCIERLCKEGYTDYIHFSFGNTLMMWENDPIYLKYKEGIVYWKGMHDWQYKDNTLEKRYERLKEISVLINSLTNTAYGDRSGALHHLAELEGIFKEKNNEIVSETF